MVGEDHRTVVVADDDPALRLLCRVNLEMEGYRVLEADSAADVERILAAEEVSLLLLDIHLGFDDGLDVARDLRVARPDVRIALFSGSIEDLPSQAAKVADGYLMKPFTLEALSETVRRLAPV